ncbi:hypothetical protein [Escherichia phage vB_EcoP-R1]|uniref:Uncharacterized protein n=1 Tax=Escherichia phage vB_EcoP-R1 TaxID=3038273 RepID=A0AA47LWB3_9CAUD|nr:hypothetical protein [Escherichia phage vB_EcoP-R1]
MTQKYRLKVSIYGWPRGTIVTKCAKDPVPVPGLVLVESTERGLYKHGAAGHNSQPDGMWGAWVSNEYLEEIGEDKPQVLPASSVPPVTVKREVLTIDKIGVGQTFIVHGKPEEVYVKISNSHVFNHKRLQMHTTDAQRFTQHLNLVVVELVVYNGK